jgi:hypothetical protein
MDHSYHTRRSFIKKSTILAVAISCPSLMTGLVNASNSNDYQYHGICHTAKIATTWAFVRVDGVRVCYHVVRCRDKKGLPLGDYRTPFIMCAQTPDNCIAIPEQDPASLKECTVDWQW